MSLRQTLTPDFRKYLEEDNGFTDLKEIDGVVVGLKRMFLTFGLMVDIREMSTQRRYCYPDEESARAALELYTKPNEHPTGPWVKVKGFIGDNMVDYLNPEFGKDDNGVCK